MTCVILPATGGGVGVGPGKGPALLPLQPASANANNVTTNECAINLTLPVYLSVDLAT